LHRHAAENVEQPDALLFGRVTYEMIDEYELVVQPRMHAVANPPQC
jgi:hypothetical protein